MPSDSVFPWQSSSLLQYKNKEQTNDLETNAASQTTLNSLTLYLFQTHNNVWNGCQKLWFKFARLHEEKVWVSSLSETVSGVEGAFFITQRVEGGGRGLWVFCLKGMDVFTWHGAEPCIQPSSGTGSWMTCQHSSPLITSIMRSRIFLFPQRDDTKTLPCNTTSYFLSCCLVISCHAALHWAGTHKQSSSRYLSSRFMTAEMFF